MIVFFFGVLCFFFVFWMARAGLFTRDDFFRLASQAEAVKAGFDPRTMEQPFLNWCLDVSSVPYAHMSAAIPGFPRCSWGDLPARLVDGTWHCSSQINGTETPL